MARKRNRRRRRKQKIFFIIEIIILIVLSLVLIVAIRGTQLLSLVNYYDADQSKILTANENNKDNITDNDVTDTQSDEITTSLSDTASSLSETTSDYEGIDIIALVGLDTRGTGDDVSYNSDTMIICAINHDEKTIKLCSIYRDTILNVGEDYYGEPDYYFKANDAYNLGGPEQFLTMINTNLDLNITQFITVDFTALAVCIDLLGGLDIPMTRQEVIHLNNYNVETSEAVGVEYEALEIPDDPNFDGVITRVFHCNGSQAVSYARIRYTEGNDYRRASRQREVLSLVKEKAKSASILTLNSVLESTLPYVTTNMDSASLISLAINIMSYDMSDENMDGFPFVHAEDYESEHGASVVVPVTLEYNVELLHDFFFPDIEYYTSSTVRKYSDYISLITGYTSDDIDYYSTLDYGEDLVFITEEEMLELQNADT